MDEKGVDSSEDDTGSKPQARETSPSSTASNVIVRSAITGASKPPLLEDSVSNEAISSEDGTKGDTKKSVADAELPLYQNCPEL